MTNQSPIDPRDARIVILEAEVADLKLAYALQFGNDKVAGALLTTLKAMAKDVHEMKTAMFGDASQAGLMVRLDRLEQSAFAARWWTRAFAAACVAELVYIIFKH